MKCFKTLALACVLAFVGTAGAATFNLFQPATGVLKGNSSTYVTTAAASSDIRALWSGTCNASSYLRGDGSCSVPAGTGVTSVGLTMPSGLSVSGSPVTSSGTLAVTTLLNGIVKGNGSGFTTAASSDVIGLWTGTCNSGTFLRADGSCQTVGGGTGTVTSVGLTVPTGLSVTGSPVTGSGTLGITTALSGIVKGNGSGFTTAASSDVIGLWSGTCNSSTVLFGDGTCAATTGASLSGTNTWTGSNTYSFPSTATVAPLIIASGGPQLDVQLTTNSADNKRWNIAPSGSSWFFRALNDAGTVGGTFLQATRSGATITNVALGNATDNPTFTFAGTGGVTLSTTGAGLVVKGNATGLSSLDYVQFQDSAGVVQGYVGKASGGSNDMYLNNSISGGSLRLATTGSGTITGNGVDMTPQTGSDTKTLNGCTSGSVTITSARVGNLATFTIPAFTCTSNATSFSITSPFSSSAMYPAHDVTCSFRGVDNSASVAAWVVIQAGGGSMGFWLLGGSSAWTASGTKGVGTGSAITCSYPVN